MIQTKTQERKAAKHAAILNEFAEMQADGVKITAAYEALGDKYEYSAAGIKRIVRAAKKEGRL